jgi:hypothetical protein
MVIVIAISFTIAGVNRHTHIVKHPQTEMIEFMDECMQGFLEYTNDADIAGVSSIPLASFQVWFISLKLFVLLNEVFFVEDYLKLNGVRCCT